MHDWHPLYHQQPRGPRRFARALVRGGRHGAFDACVMWQVARHCAAASEGFKLQLKYLGVDARVRGGGVAVRAHELPTFSESQR